MLELVCFQTDRFGRSVFDASTFSEPNNIDIFDTEYGAPVEIYSDNDPEFCGKNNNKQI
jgi:hypothetical protein